jgi:hypothetical protein
MLPIRGVIALANRTETEILPAVDSGALRWVFDVATDPSQARRRELRFLAESVADFVEGKESALEWEDVYRLLIPHSESMITSPEVAHCLNVHGDVPLMLGERGALRICKAGKRGATRTGHYAATLFSRESFEQFLKERLV